jgi:hypothetical protein
MSAPTPRTDAAWCASFDGEQMSAGETARALRECSQQLETELATLTAEVERLRSDRDCEKRLRKDADEFRENAIERAERAEAELADWFALKLWGGTPEIVHEFIKGQQARINHCQDIEAILNEETNCAEKAEAALAFIAEHGGKPHETECGTINCNGLWCAEQARCALAAMKEGAKWWHKSPPENSYNPSHSWIYFEGQ